jgi:hypothetical protein
LPNATLALVSTGVSLKEKLISAILLKNNMVKSKNFTAQKYDKERGISSSKRTKLLNPLNSHKIA